MKRISLLILSVIITSSVIFTGCKKDSKTPPVANFQVCLLCSTTITAGTTINFTDLSTGAPATWDWSFSPNTGISYESGTTASTANPYVKFSTAGTYNVSLTVTNTDGSNTTTKNNYITVTPANTDITFNNLIYTPISITCNGETKTASVGGSATFYSVSGTSISYTASTSGTTTSGSQVGLAMSWGSSIALSGGTKSLDLILDNTYFFLNIINAGYSTLYDLYVNYGLASETYDNVSFPWTSSSTKSTGYYKAWTNSNVRLTYTDAALQVWNMTAYQGTNFTLPFTNNQSVTISFSPNAKSMNFTATSIPLTKGAIPQYAVAK